MQNCLYVISCVDPWGQKVSIHRLSSMWPISIPMSMAISSIDSVGAFNQSKNTPTDKQTVGEDAVHSWKTEMEIAREGERERAEANEQVNQGATFVCSRFLVCSFFDVPFAGSRL